MCVCACKPPAKSGLDLSQALLLCDSLSKSRNGRRFGLGGHRLVGVSKRFHPLLFFCTFWIQTWHFPPSPHLGEQGPSQGVSSTSSQPWIKLWGALGETWAVPQVLEHPDLSWLFLLFTAARIAGGSTELSPSASAKPSQTFQPLIPARFLSLGRN